MVMKKILNIIIAVIILCVLSMCRTATTKVWLYTSENGNLETVENRKARNEIITNVMNNGNSFVHVYKKNKILIWTYYCMDNRNILKVTNVNSNGRLWNLYYAYPYPISWIDSLDKLDYMVYQSEYMPIQHRNDFSFYNRYDMIPFTSTLEQDTPIEVDTLSNIFMRNELRDYRDYILPLENSEYRIIR